MKKPNFKNKTHALPPVTPINLNARMERQLDKFQGEEIVRSMLAHIGEDPHRDGLVDTPARVVKAWKELFGGYQENPAEILSKRFTAEKYDQMIIERDIEFYSTCEHHLQPFFGHVSIGYIPNPKKGVVGISKLARLVDCYARRLQIQERLTTQISDAIFKHLDAYGVGVVIRAQHFCMVCRGVRKTEARMITSSMAGLFREGPVRSEFLTLIGQK